MIMSLSCLLEPHQPQHATAKRMQSRLLWGSAEEFCNVLLLSFLRALNSGQHNGRRHSTVIRTPMRLGGRLATTKITAIQRFFRISGLGSVNEAEIGGEASILRPRHPEMAPKTGIPYTKTALAEADAATLVDGSEAITVANAESVEAFIWFDDVGVRCVLEID
jgi:hypothetical protein